MNSDKMIQYIKFVSDRLLEQLGYSKLFNIFKKELCKWYDINAYTALNYKPGQNYSDGTTEIHKYT